MNKTLSVATVLTALSLTACTQVPAGWQGVKVDDWGDPTVNGCVPEETQEGTFSETVYQYPARDISWDASDDPNADPERKPYEVLSNAKDQAYMKVPVTVVFDLTTDCDKLKQFHRDLGTKYTAWQGGTDNESGWVSLLNYVIGQPLEQTLIGISQKYTYQQIWNDEAIRTEYKNALQAQLPKEAAARTNGVDYFSDFVVTIGKPEPVDQRLRDARAAEQASQAEAAAKQTQATADANARQSAAEAELRASQAETATAEQDARKRQAEIAGFGEGPGAVEAWLKWKAITEKSITPWPAPIIAGRP